jgi:exonuclease III
MKTLDFTVTTYNMFAKSLGTNTIPWVMNVSPTTRKRVEDATNYSSFNQWVEKELKPEYLQHFHKNFQSGHYAAMRSFWGAPKLDSSKDIPAELNGLTWVGEDTICYTTEEAQTKEAMTLKGLSKKCLPQDIFREFFEEIISKEQGVYSWDVRGPRIFETLSQHGPDIVSIQEYDCHDTKAEYRGKGCLESFSEAMSSVGYSGVFLKDPLLGRDPPSGMGVFWLNDTFETVCGTTGMESLDCNIEGSASSIWNVDMEERWHPNSSNNGGPEIMKAADRRSGALCRLQHKKTRRFVSLCTAHLMTTSRDSIKTNKFPGEVRACELAALRNLVQKHIHSEDAVILVGDFNTDTKNAKNIFSGKIKAADSDEVCDFDTGFDSKSALFVWDQHQLQDAFAALHKWGEGVGEDKHCTSRNANRVEWIDYIFFDRIFLQPVGLSDCQTPSSSIPDETNPSDHIPLVAEFRFL